MISKKDPASKTNTRYIETFGRLCDCETLECRNIGTVAQFTSDSLGETLSLSIGQLLMSVPFEEIQTLIDEVRHLARESEELKKALATPVERTDLSIRAIHCLKNSNVRTLGDLVQKTEKELLRMRNIGVATLDEIKQMLTDYGLELEKEDSDEVLPHKN